ncbi:MAG: hypothetical protein HOW73_42875 [Polyangiaceae bacterium]|nr:hypothetical protein [Polyangiaceae bacterium]
MDPSLRLTFKSWEVDVQMLEPTIVELVYRGDVPADAIKQVSHELKALLRGRKNVTGWLVDAMEMKQMTLAPSDAMLEVFELWKGHGGKRFAMATQLAMAKMLGTALRFSKVIPLEICGSRAAAIAYLKGA